MSVTFHIPGPLRPFTGGLSQVDIGASPATVGDALEALWALNPGMRDRMATEQGQIREHNQPVCRERKCPVYGRARDALIRWRRHLDRSRYQRRIKP